jgi:hypothetical protein
VSISPSNLEPTIKKKYRKNKGCNLLYLKFIIEKKLAKSVPNTNTQLTPDKHLLMVKKKPRRQAADKIVSRLNHEKV